MPQNTTIASAAGAWTLLTDADVTSITFQNTSSQFVIIKGTTNTTAPTTKDGALRYNPGQGERAVTLIDLFPGVSGVKRLWVFSNDTASVVVSHA